MNKIIFFLGLILGLSNYSLAQAPQSFKYQAVARNTVNQPYVDTNLGIRISLVQDNVTGIVDYSEAHNIITSSLGVFDLQIGEGNPIFGSFSTIDWSAHPYFLKVDIDPNGGTNYINMGSSQLLSVPYAIYSNKSGSDSDNQTISLNGTLLVIENGNAIDLATIQDGVEDADANPNNEIQSLTFDINTNELSISGGNSISIPTGGTDADADPNNEIQTLSFDSNINELSISEGNSIVIPTGSADADADPSNEIQNLSFDFNTNELSISGGNSISIPSGGTDADADPQNELQTISKSGNTVTLSNGGGSFTDEVNDADADASNEIQNLHLNGTNLSIENGNTIDLSLIQDGVEDNDANPTNELQELILNASNLQISNGNSVDLSALQDGVEDADADPQNELQGLALNGSILGISNGNSVSLANIGSSLWDANGNHVYFQGGRVGIGETNPDENLVVGNNLGSGWAVPAATIGGNSGGAIEVGGNSYKMSMQAGNNLSGTRFISSGPSGNSEIQMLTNGLSIGENPGPLGLHMLKVVHGSFGIIMARAGTDNNWEFLTSSAANSNLNLYANGSYISYFNGTDGSYNTISDISLKTNIQSMGLILPSLLQLNPSRYQYIHNNPDKKQSIGFIAQELKEYFPEFVQVSKDERSKGLHAVNYAGLSVIAIKAIQEQQEIIEDLTARLEKLEALLQEK